MSVTTETNRTAELTTDGVETEFDFSLLIHATSEVQVWYKVTDGAYSQLTLNTDYGVVFTEDGGTVSTDGYRAPLAAGKLLIIRHLELTQQTNWLYNDNHSEQQHQDDFDRSAMRDIQIQEQLDRVLMLAIHSSITGIICPEPEANMILGWNAGGTNLTNINPITIAVLIADEIIAGSVPGVLTDLTDVTVDAPVAGNLLRYDGAMWENYPEQTVGIANDNLLEVDGSPHSGEYARFTANGLEGRTEAEFKGDFNLEIGTDVQAWDAVLDDLSVLAVVADNEFIVGTEAGVYAHESGNVARTSLGLGTGDSPTFTNVTGTGFGRFGNLTLASGSITDSGGAISFGNENLSTTGFGRFDGGIGVGKDPGFPLDIVSSSAVSTELKVDNTGGGDVALGFYIGGVKKWFVGVDNSDSDKFKIAQGIFGGDSYDALAIDSSGNFAFGGNMVGGTYDGVTLASAGQVEMGANANADFWSSAGVAYIIDNTDGFILTGGATPRDLTVTGGDWTIDQSVASGASPTLDGTNFTGIPSAGVTNNVSATANITDHAIVRGHGGAKVVQASGIIIDDSDNVSAMGTLGCGAITGTKLGLGVAPFTTDNYTTNLCIANLVDEDFHSVILKAGSAAQQRNYIKWVDHENAQRWLMGVNAGDDFIVYSSGGGLNIHRLHFVADGGTYIDSVGSERVYINASGSANSGTGGLNIRSGGASPTTLFQCSGANTYILNDLWIKPDGSTVTTYFRDGDILFYYPLKINSSVRIGSLSAPTVALDVTGAAKISTSLAVDTTTLVVNATSYEDRVGIGTASPGTTLEIQSSSPVLRLRDTGATANATTAYVEFGGTNAAAWSRTGFVGDASSGNTDIYLQAEISDLHLGDSSGAAVMNLQGGNVGIGLTTVDANYKLIIKRVANVNLGIGLQSSELAIAAFNDALSANIPMRFYASEFNLLNGNVGINETAPQDKLEVNGTVLVKDKLKFTQDDGNEYIDSLADGYLDLAATTGIRLNSNVRIGSAVAPTVALDVTGDALISGTFSVTGALTFSDDVTIADAKDIILGTATGTKIGTSNVQKLGFWSVAPVIQPSHIADAADAAGDPPTQAEYNALVGKFNAVLDQMARIGLHHSTI